MAAPNAVALPVELGAEISIFTLWIGKDPKLSIVSHHSMETIIELCCENCGTIFKRRQIEIRRRNCKHIFCSRKCDKEFKDRKVEVVCQQCHMSFYRQQCDINQNKRNSKSDNLFCSKSCAAVYNNLHKTHGARRSKLEVWLEEQLRKLYPNLEILFNAKKTINAELDIHFLSLNLAFELNGIYHYEPIHGQGKLTSIQSNDHRKFAACAEKDISLCVIDVSAMNYFKPTKGQQFLEIIANLVNEKLKQG